MDFKVFDVKQDTSMSKKIGGIIYSYLFVGKKEFGQALWTWFHMEIEVANAFAKLKFEISKWMCMKSL